MDPEQPQCALAFNTGRELRAVVPSVAFVHARKLLGRYFDRGCGGNVGLGYAANPRLSRYSRGLREPREILIRFSLYQRM